MVRCVLLPREETVENRTSPVGLVSRDSPKAAHQFRNVFQECAFGNRGTIWIPRFPNGRLGKIVPPLFGGISFPSGSFAIGKRVLGNIFNSFPRRRSISSLRSTRTSRSRSRLTSPKCFVMRGKLRPTVAGITERPCDSRLDFFVLFASGV